jgi:hypothetical protein
MLLPLFLSSQSHRRPDANGLRRNRCNLHTLLSREVVVVVTDVSQVARRNGHR